MDEHVGVVRVADEHVGVARVVDEHVGVVGHTTTPTALIGSAALRRRDRLQVPAPARVVE